MPRKHKPKLSPIDHTAARNLHRLFEEKRDRYGWTQNDLARAYGEGNKGTPVTQGAMSQYLNGTTRIGTVATLKFAKIFEVRPTEIRPDFEYAHVTTSELPVDVLTIASKLAMFNKDVRNDIAKTIDLALELGPDYGFLIDGIREAYRTRREAS